MKLRLGIITVCLAGMLITSASASNILDLTSMVEGGEASHTCILESKYDSDYHWQECKLCFNKYDIIKHSLKVTTTMGSMCAEANKLITTCLWCEYSKEEPAGYEHGKSYAILCPFVTEGWASLRWWCSVCGDGYCRSEDGWEWYYRDGAILNPNDAYKGLDVIAPGNWYVSIINMSRAYSVLDEKYTYYQDGEYIIIDAEYKVDQRYADTLTDYQITHPTKAYIRAYGLVRGYPGLCDLVPYDIVFDRPSLKLTFKCRFLPELPTVDKSGDSYTILWYEYGFNEIEDELYGNKNSVVFTYEYDPTIGECGYEV